MLQKISNLKGVQKLNRNQKHAIQGGRKKCTNWAGECIDYGTYCAEIECVFIP